MRWIGYWNNRKKWILAFNPYYSSTDISKYEALKNTTYNKNFEYYNKQAEAYLIFDDINSVV